MEFRLGGSMPHHSHPMRSALSVLSLLAGLICVFSAPRTFAQSGAWLTHSHDARHTGLSSVASQPLATVHWQTPVDLAPPSGEIFIHYGSPLVTSANTVVVPVKTGSNSFRIEAHNGATGNVVWMHNTAYRAPSAN